MVFLPHADAWNHRLYRLDLKGLGARPFDTLLEDDFPE